MELSWWELNAVTHVVNARSFFLRNDQVAKIAKMSYGDNKCIQGVPESYIDHQSLNNIWEV